MQVHDSGEEVGPCGTKPEADSRVFYVPRNVVCPVLALQNHSADKHGKVGRGREVPLVWPLANDVSLVDCTSTCKQVTSDTGGGLIPIRR